MRSSNDSDRKRKRVALRLFFYFMEEQILVTALPFCQCSSNTSGFSRFYSYGTHKPQCQWNETECLFYDTDLTGVNRCDQYKASFKFKRWLEHLRTKENPNCFCISTMQLFISMLEAKQKVDEIIVDVHWIDWFLKLKKSIFTHLFRYSDHMG